MNLKEAFIWLARNWDKLPRGLRALFYVAVVVLAYTWGKKSWDEGLLREWLGATATKQDLQQQFDSLKVETVQLSTLMAQQMLRDYNDSLKRIRDSAERHILQPMLRNQLDQLKRLQRLESAQGMTNQHINAMSSRTSEQLERLVQHTERDDTRTDVGEVMEAIMQRLDNIEERLDQPPPPNKRNTRQKF